MWFSHYFVIWFVFEAMSLTDDSIFWSLWSACHTQMTELMFNSFLYLAAFRVRTLCLQQTLWGFVIVPKFYQFCPNLFYFPSRETAPFAWQFSLITRPHGAWYHGTTRDRVQEIRGHQFPSSLPLCLWQKPLSKDPRSFTPTWNTLRYLLPLDSRILHKDDTLVDYMMKAVLQVIPQRFSWCSVQTFLSR